MAYCPYCGEKVGLFEKEHGICVREFQNRLATERAHQQEEARREEEERKRREEKERKRREYEVWRTRHSALVEKFLEVAERKVSRLDEYGDENWDILPKEIETVLLKAAKVDGEFIDSIKSLLSKRASPDFMNAYLAELRRRTGVPWRDRKALFEKCLFISHYLESEFRSFYDSRKAVSAVDQDFSTMTGVDFEVCVAKLLKEAGFDNVAGTPATGDQGADLIVKRNWKTIAIQVKGYVGPVGNGAVQEIVSALKFYKADEAWVVTNSSFTPSARSLAQANNVRLIDGHDLRDFMRLVQEI